MQPAAQPAAQFLSSYERHTLAEIQKKKIWWSGGGVFGGDTIELGPAIRVHMCFFFFFFSCKPPITLQSSFFYSFFAVAVRLAGRLTALER